ncbi:MAG: ribose-phosphate diphosphokinase [Gammaproteobacteria bacterium]|nr:ribose-phosphate diphosphokinase [Gammaproteobacteria bacterium]MDH5691608.1 ribose-phosphate diphosphokinase [Gammaproteobacteria bacterium]
MVVLGFEDYRNQSQNLAKALGCAYLEPAIRQFPDEETLIKLPPVNADHVVVCRSLNRPNHKLIELFLIAKTLRAQGIKHITLICPYLCYMRQDTQNEPGEVVSQKIIGQWLAELFDDVITVDPHLHRISRLAEAIPLKNALSLSASELMASHVAKQLKDAILFGPDEESEQWVSTAAQHAGLSYAVGKKVRHGDTEVSIELPDYDFRSKTIIIMDDVASTGRTITQAAKLLRKAGAGDVFCLITHALFSGDAEQHLLENGITQIWSTDSISHKSNVVALSDLLLVAIRNIQNT